MRRRQGPDRPPSGLNLRFIAAGVAAVVLLLVVFVGPGTFHIWSSQKAQTRALDTKISNLDRANAQLATRAAALRDPEAIKELARRDYGMVPKGSVAYAILPAPLPDERPDGIWPFIDLHRSEAQPSTTGR